MSTRFTRLAGLLGIVAPIFTLTFIFVSVALSPWFSWHDNALSDMGVSRTSNPFNAALLIGGMMYLVFVVGFLRWQGTTSIVNKVAAFFMLAGGVGLLLVGIFTEDAGRIHYGVAVTYFVATPLAYVLFGADWLRRGKHVPGVLSVTAGLATLLMIACVPHKRYAVPEILAAVIIGAWTLSFGVTMLFEMSKAMEDHADA